MRNVKGTPKTFEYMHVCIFDRRKTIVTHTDRYNNNYIKIICKTNMWQKYNTLSIQERIDCCSVVLFGKRIISIYDVARGSYSVSD